MILFIKRLTAYWLDFVILAIFLLGVQGLLYLITNGFPFDHFVEGYQIELWVLLTISLPAWSYFIASELIKQKTLGKRLFKLVVTNKSGMKISFKQAFLRTCIKLLPWELTHIIIFFPDPWWSQETPENLYLILIPNILLVIYILILFLSKGKLGLHDYFVQTRVGLLNTTLKNTFSINSKM